MDLSLLCAGVPPVDVLNYYCSLPEVVEAEVPHIEVDIKKDSVLMPSLLPK